MIEISTRLGRLRGGTCAVDVGGFFGIPYAVPPVGSLRWRPPEAPAAWSGLRDATRFGPDPIQPAGLRKSRAPGQSEDCLYLNIWAPKRKRAGGWPVLVWLCGGGFTTGSGAFVEEDPAGLAARGAVVVSVNVRLNIFGFLAHPELTAQSPHGASGNYGLMDLEAALGWVRENIADFGGDPARLTFFGESAGATMGMLLLAAPAVHGPYDRAIFQSPGSFNALLSRPEAERHGAGLGERIADLRALSAADLVARANRLPPASPSLWLARPLRPIVDGWLIRTNDPTNSTDFRPVPAIVGTNEDEGRFFEARMDVRTADDLRLFATRIFGDRAQAALDHYGLDDVSAAFSALYGDRGFNLPIDRLARHFARAGGDIRRYIYTYRPDGTDRPPTHGDEIGVLMGLLPRATRRDDAMTGMMTRLWLAFAETGRPACGDVHWPAYDEQDNLHLRLDQPAVIRAGWRSEHIDFMAENLVDQ